MLLGTLSDGDLRRGILKGETFDSSIANIHCKEPISLLEQDFEEHSAKEVMVAVGLLYLPIVDANNKILGIKGLDDVQNEVRRDHQLPDKTRVVIMAGGRGTRLSPVTKCLPKGFGSFEG